MEKRTLLALLAGSTLLAACGGPENNNAVDAEATGLNMPNARPDGRDATTTPTDENGAGSEDGNGGPGNDEGGAAATIPARFHGEWNSDRSACGTGNSETRLRIDADRLRFYESVGEVVGVDVESDRVIEVTAAYRGEGESWTNERRLALSADGGSLTVSGDGASLVRTRCP